MNKLVSVVGVLGLSLVGCGTDEGAGNDGPEVLPNLLVPAPPEHGIQVITPIVRGLEPGSDHEICTWTDAVVTDGVIDVKSTTGYQTEPGHHIVVYYTTEPQPAGTQRECTDSDMLAFRIVTGNGKEGEPYAAPGNLVYRIPKGAQIVINHHYLNATDEIMDGQSAVNINFAPEGGTYIPSGATAFLNSGLEVAQGVSTQKQHCVVDREMKLWFMVPHMHRWGTHIAVDLTRSATGLNPGEKTNLFDTVWDESYTFHPPEKLMDLAAPLVLHPGDEIDTTCTWNNDTGRNLNFGFEMCVTFGQFIDDKNQGSWACDNGQWGDF
jgi:hypothetical protein